MRKGLGFYRVKAFELIDASDKIDFTEEELYKLLYRTTNRFEKHSVEDFVSEIVIALNKNLFEGSFEKVRNYLMNLVKYNEKNLDKTDAFLCRIMGILMNGDKHCYNPKHTRLLQRDMNTIKTALAYAEDFTGDIKARNASSYAFLKPLYFEYKDFYWEHLICSTRVNDYRSITGYIEPYNITKRFACVAQLVRLWEDEIEPVKELFKESVSPTGSNAQKLPDLSILNDEAKQKFERAIKAGLMEKSGSGFKWKESKASLAYFCGKIFCGDTLRKDSVTQEELVKRGCEYFPDKQLSDLFNMKNLGQSRLQLNRPPNGRKKIDDLF